MIAALPQQLSVVDTTSHIMTGDILFPFAFDEVSARKVGQEMLGPIVHLWRHQRAFVLGARDAKLQNAGDAVRWLENSGYRTAVRNSGGAAVPLDPGVVNISLILPIPQGSLNVHRHFELMADLIRESLPHPVSDSVETGEIGGSYCPGEFDVSMAGKKFCGIAQRRQTRAVVVQAFVLVEGSGEERATAARTFYDIAARGSTESDYPSVTPKAMASLSELAGLSSAETYVNRFKKLLSTRAELVEFTGYSTFPLEEVDQTIVELRARHVSVL